MSDATATEFAGTDTGSDDAQFMLSQAELDAIIAERVSAAVAEAVAAAPPPAPPLPGTYGAYLEALAASNAADPANGINPLTEAEWNLHGGVQPDVQGGVGYA